MQDKGYIRDNFQPVLLGNTRKARKMARALYRKYNIVAYVCDRHSPLFSELIFSRTFFRVSGAELPDELSDELLYLASLDPACAYIAVPFTEKYKLFLEKYSDTLLALYLIRNADGIFSDIPFINNENGGHSNDASFPS